VWAQESRKKRMHVEKGTSQPNRRYPLHPTAHKSTFDAWGNHNPLQRRRGRVGTPPLAEASLALAADLRSAQRLAPLVLPPASSSSSSSPSFLHQPASFSMLTFKPHSQPCTRTDPNWRMSCQPVMRRPKRSVLGL